MMGTQGRTSLSAALFFPSCIHVGLRLLRHEEVTFRPAQMGRDIVKIGNRG